MIDRQALYEVAWLIGYTQRKGRDDMTWMNDERGGAGGMVDGECRKGMNKGRNIKL